MRVIATAGHVDHGKSALVRALTGIEPDRWEEEHRRGMTIDLGYAWTTLASGEELAFVDVPGHQRFIGNMLAGLGPAPAVLFVVAADEGWRQQSGEHLAAVDALGLRHGLLVVTRCDLADPAAALEDAAQRLAASSLGACQAVAVSARTGEGLAELRAALDRLVSRLPDPVTGGRVRLWVDRSFTIRGSGTVVTGTLGEGTIAVGDQLQLGRETVRVRGVQSLGRARDSVSAVARVAVNLRGVGAHEVHRGDVLLTPGAWPVTSSVDVRLSRVVERLPASLMVHVGTVGTQARVRPLGAEALRLTTTAPLPLRAGDRMILRDPGAQHVLAGATVVDADPPPLRRRGAAARRGQELAHANGSLDLGREVARRGAMLRQDAVALGLAVDDDTLGSTDSIVREGDWLISVSTWHGWADALRAAVRAQAARDPLEPTLTLEAARVAAGVADRVLVPPVANAAGLHVAGGRVGAPEVRPRLGDRAEAGLRTLEARLREEPFAAPERPDLEAAGLGTREVAAAVRTGRLIRFEGDVLLLPSSPARAMQVLARLPQPFTTSQARQALDTTRRVVIPLLEHLDGRGWTRRLDGSHREVRR
ncbi:MAG TPA: selenocysteine-specific translation elongation factor [Intrasporangium sp.]|uniref:selenocysteine-specific translation elongation factor n=1 Tax=Intrasporangium sp. TaxID=1925024 RepID=UPI002D766C8B|nr:selenocysteine-specific translation elongation factor [Intrasporangium sp.]HET7398111.1 selenocysteine-specific translation elongation factor [Intrasporangium sp.]